MKHHYEITIDGNDVTAASSDLESYIVDLANTYQSAIEMVQIDQSTFTPEFENVVVVDKDRIATALERIADALEGEHPEGKENLFTWLVRELREPQ